jgi:hypothetical protein
MPNPSIRTHLHRLGAKERIKSMVVKGERGQRVDRDNIRQVKVAVATSLALDRLTYRYMRLYSDYLIHPN